MLRVAGKVTAGVIGVGALGAYKIRDDMGPDAMNRLLSFYSVAIPMVVEYKTLEIKCEKLPQILPQYFDPVSQEEESKLFEPLHEKWKQPLVDKFLELGGFFYKNGQRGAGNMGGFVPKIYQDAMQVFLDKIPPRDFEREILPLIESELCNKVGAKSHYEVFEYIDPKPLGCASIGQVHRAILINKNKKLNGGKNFRVVIKVQDPSAEATFRGDVFALKTICSLFFPQGLPAFEEMERQFKTEFDYRREANNGMTIRENLLEKFPNVVVPEVYPDLCTKKILVMEEIYPAIPLIQALENQASNAAREQGFKGTTQEFIELEKKKQEINEKEAALKGEMIKTIDAETMSKYIYFQKTKQMVKNVTSYCFSWFPFASSFYSYENQEKIDDVQNKVFIPLNLAKIMDDLLNVHGHEIFIDGVFNGDPHPGNILYISAEQSPDGREKLGLIDYGQVKRIKKEFRYKMAETFILTEAAMKFDPRSLKNAKKTKEIEKDATVAYNTASNMSADEEIDFEKTFQNAKKALAKNMVSVGFKSEKMLEDTMYEMCTVYYGRDDAAWLYPLNFVQWSDQLQAKDPLGNLKEIEDAVMITMAGLYLRGLGHSIQQPRNLAEAWLPFAKQALEESGKLEQVQKEINSWITVKKKKKTK